MDNISFYLEMAGSDVEMMQGTFTAHGMAVGKNAPLHVMYPRGQQWFETDTVMRLLPDETPKRIEFAISTTLGDVVGTRDMGSTHMDPNTYVLTDRTGLTLNINFKDKHLTMVHDNHVYSSSIKLKLIYED